MSAIPVPVGPLYGSLYFSAVLSVGFYGVTCMQTFFYYIHYPDDPLHTKSFVGIVWALDTIHQALIISGAYKFILAGLMNPLSFDNVVPELYWELLLTTLVSVPTQGFFVYRIYRFSEKTIIVPLIWIPLGLFQLVATLLYIGKAAPITTLVTFGDTFFTDLSIAYCAVAAAVDIFIAVCLTYLLVRRRIATGFKRSARVLQLLTVFAINSGIWTTTFAVLDIIFLRAYPNELIYLVFDFALCSVYCNTLLANLNARSYITNPSSTVNVSADLVTDFLELGKQRKTESNELDVFPSARQGTKSPGLVSSESTDAATDTNRSLSFSRKPENGENGENDRPPLQSFIPIQRDIGIR